MPRIASVSVERHLEALIASGRLKPGDPLPGVRALAQICQVDKGTAMRACRALMARGRIERGAGQRATPRVATTSHLPLAGTLVIVTALHLHSDSTGARPGWMAGMCNGALAAVAEAGLATLLLPPGRCTQAEVASLLAAGAAGFVVLEELAESGRAALRQAVAAGLPVAAFAGMTDVDCDTVKPDHRCGGFLLAKHLIASGRRRLLFALELHGSASASGSASATPWITERRAGMARACRQAGLAAPLYRHWQVPVAPAATVAEFRVRCRVAAAELVDLLTAPDAPDALLCGTDGSLLRLGEAARLCHRPVGANLALAGYDGYWADNTERAFSSIQPSVTVDVRWSAIGRAVVALWQERRDGRLPQAAQHRLVEPVLVAITT